jgi:O-antigen ligase
MNVAAVSAAQPAAAAPGRRLPWWVRAADWLQAGSLCLLLLFLPFSKAAIEITSVLLLIGWTLRRLHPATRGETAWLSPAWRPIALCGLMFLAACAASIPGSTHPQQSLEALVSKWAQYLSLTLICADLGRRLRLVQVAFGFAAVGAGLVAFDGIWQEAHRAGLAGSFFRPDHRFDFYGRITGPYENPIDLATYLMVIIPVLTGWSLTLRRVLRPAAWMLILVLLACFVRTEALGAGVGLAVALIALTACRPIRRLAIAGLLIGALAAGIVLARNPQWSGALSPNEIGKIDRLVMWQAGMGMVHDRPVLGLGLNTFMANYLTYWVGGEYQPRYAHNCYLQVAAETGLVGLVTFLGLLLSLGARLWAGVLQPTERRHVMAAGCLVGLAAFAAQAAIDTNFYALRQAALFWTLAGLALGLATPASQTAAPTRP